ncbi:(2Fe-2S)-binding protein [Devosia sp. A449]
MFKKLTADAGSVAPEQVTLTVDGRIVVAQAGDTVAAALLATGQINFRMSPTSGKPRGPYCMMGVCFECLVTIDGRAGRQACMTSVVAGMDIRTDTGANPS